MLTRAGVLQEEHIKMVEAVNNAETEHEHHRNELLLEGYRRALSVYGWSGWHLVECDLHYINQGVDRPMCCGVFLDWKPLDSQSGEK